MFGCLFSCFSRNFCNRFRNSFLSLFFYRSFNLSSCKNLSSALVNHNLALDFRSCFRSLFLNNANGLFTTMKNFRSLFFCYGSFFCLCSCKYLSGFKILGNCVCALRSFNCSAGNCLGSSFINHNFTLNLRRRRFGSLNYGSLFNSLFGLFFCDYDCVANCRTIRLIRFGSLIIGCKSYIFSSLSLSLWNLCFSNSRSSLCGFDYFSRSFCLSNLFDLSTCDDLSSAVINLKLALNLGSRRFSLSSNRSFNLFFCYGLFLNGSFAYRNLDCNLFALGNLLLEVLNLAGLYYLNGSSRSFFSLSFLDRSFFNICSRSFNLGDSFFDLSTCNDLCCGGIDLNFTLCYGSSFNYRLFFNNSNDFITAMKNFLDLFSLLFNYGSFYLCSCKYLSGFKILGNCVCALRSFNCSAGNCLGSSFINHNFTLNLRRRRFGSLNYGSLFNSLFGLFFCDYDCVANLSMLGLIGFCILMIRCKSCKFGSFLSLNLGSLSLGNLCHRSFNHLFGNRLRSLTCKNLSCSFINYNLALNLRCNNRSFLCYHRLSFFSSHSLLLRNYEV